MKKLREVEEVGEGFASFFRAKDEWESAIVKDGLSMMCSEGTCGEDMTDSV